MPRLTVPGKNENRHLIRESHSILCCRGLYFDRFVKTEDELPTIGIVLCRRKNDALVELTLPKDASIFAPKYQLYLPSKEELKQQLEKIEAELGGLANG
jgi:hypothetical protein